MCAAASTPMSWPSTASPAGRPRRAWICRRMASSRGCWAHESTAGAAAALPVRATAATHRRHRAQPRVRADFARHRRAPPCRAGADRRGIARRDVRAVQLPGHRRHARASRGDSRLDSSPLRPDAGRRQPGAAGQWFARSAVRDCADRGRPVQAGARRRLPKSVLSDLRRRRAARGRRRLLRQRRPGAQFRGRLVPGGRADLGPHPAGVCLLAGQPERRRDAAGRMAGPVRAERPPWLCDCVR
mmetsp:Transcript_11767/g.27539  ORF Transcript_11767/g.27539 Transcript_11767/m.27539 type:complete len:243 (-) Transcript_11767:475-1203(-)